MGKRIELTREQQDQIIYNYTVLKWSRKRSGAFIPVSDGVVKRILEENNIHVKTLYETNINKFNVKHDYFKNQTSDMGYWIGILGSDGCVASQSNQIYIELQRQDKELLEKLNLSIQNERPVKDYITGKGYENSKIYFYSKEIKKDLSTFHIIPNKTYSDKYDFPELLNKEFYPDYIRGLFDGDGCIKQTEGHSPCWQIDLGKESIALKIIDIFKEQNIKINYTYMPKKNVTLTRIYSYGKNTLQQIYNYLYFTGSNLFLKRKKDKIEEILKMK